jgi:hypothetical protein
VLMYATAWVNFRKLYWAKIVNPKRLLMWFNICNFLNDNFRNRG